MKKKAKVRKATKKQTLSNSKLLFLSVILLLVVFEALYMVKNQISSAQPQVAGISTHK
jgi:hypothetical protein